MINLTKINNKDKIVVYSKIMNSYDDAFDEILSELNSIKYWVIDGIKREDQKAYNTFTNPMEENIDTGKLNFPIGKHKFAYGDKMLSTNEYIFKIEIIN